MGNLAIGPADGWGESLWRIFPDDLRAALSELDKTVRSRLEEIRLRVGQPIHLYGSSLDAFLKERGGVTTDARQALVASTNHIRKTMERATQASLYAVEEDLRRGYVTVQGGHRVGIGGRVAVTETGHIRSIRTITSMNVRVARAWPGVADRIRSHLLSKQEAPLSVLILSPPGCGKTTLLRDIARQWSSGLVSRAGRKVTVVDERSEIAGAIDGIPQFDLGPRTDVLDGCPKADGMLMAIRSLSPHLLVTDEIGRRDDVDAILESLNAGVSVVASAHANSLEEWKKRPYMNALFQSNSFHRYVLLSRKGGPCSIDRVYRGDGLPWPTRSDGGSSV